MLKFWRRPGGARMRSNGAGFAIAAYAIWGFAPIYFVWVSFAGPFEILSHRILWSILLLSALLTALKRWPTLRQLSLRSVLALLLSGLLIAVNWGVYVWSIDQQMLVQASLGYYLNPLVNVALGVVLLRERLRPLQWLAVVIAGTAVLHEVLAFGGLPWISLVLSCSFAFYGFVRKQVGVDPFVGLFVETLLVGPLAFWYLWHLSATGTASTATDELWPLLKLALGGLVTIVPLLCFAAAAARMPLAILGLFQYLAPSIALLLAVGLFGEAFTVTQTITFALIWLALLIFSLEALYDFRRQRVLA